MIKEDMPKKVFFLGAGFSKAVNGFYPLLKRTPNSLKSTSLGLTEIVLLSFEKKYKNTPLAKHLAELPESLNDNIEELLTYLNTDFPWKEECQKKQDEALYEALTIEIVNEINTIDKRKRSSAPNSLFDDDLDNDNINPVEFIKYVNNNKYPVITLNYDTLFEELTLKHHIVEQKDVNLNHGDLYQIPIVNLHNRLGSNFWDNRNHQTNFCSHLLKLHGSVNWLFSKMSNTLYYEYNLPENETYLEMDLIPYIIPPVLDKNSLYNHQLIKSLWQKAHEYLENAEEIYIIGFSLPQTDISVKFLFQAALKHSRAQVYIINPQKQETLEASFSNLFGGRDLGLAENWQQKRIDYTYTGIKRPLEEFINKEILAKEGANA